MTHQEVCTGAGDEAQSIIAWLHVLPEVNIGVVEDVGVHVEVVETLRRQDHADVVPTIKVWYRLQEKFLARNLWFPWS